MRTSQTPILGEYGTDDPMIAATHVSWACSHGIDGFLVSWEGRNSVTDVHLRNGLLSAENIRTLKLIVVYEGTSIAAGQSLTSSGADFNDFAVRAKFLDDIAHLSQYFWHESYFFLSGRPVVVLRSSQNYRNMPRHFLRTAEARIGIEFFFVGDEISFRESTFGREDRATVCTDCRAFTALDMTVGNATVDYESLSLHFAEVNIPTYKLWSRQSLSVFPLLAPRIGRFRQSMLSGNATDFGKQVTLARTLKFDPVTESVRTIMFVQSFNQWFEETAIEPGKQFGFDFLDALSVSAEPKIDCDLLPQ